MPFMPNPLNPGPLGMAMDIMNYTTNPHIESAYNPITARDSMGHPIRDQVFERDSIGQPIWGSRVTGRDSIGQPITIPVIDLTKLSSSYRFDNLGSVYDSQLGKQIDSFYDRCMMATVEADCKRTNELFKRLQNTIARC